MSKYKCPYVIVDGEQVLTANYHELDMWRVRMAIDKTKRIAVAAIIFSIIAVVINFL